MDDPISQIPSAINEINFGVSHAYLCTLIPPPRRHLMAMLVYCDAFTRIKFNCNSINIVFITVGIKVGVCLILNTRNTQ